MRIRQSTSTGASARRPRTPVSPPKCGAGPPLVLRPSRRRRLGTCGRGRVRGSRPIDAVLARSWSSRCTGGHDGYSMVDPVHERRVLPAPPDGLARARRRDPHRRDTSAGTRTSRALARRPIAVVDGVGAANTYNSHEMLHALVAGRHRWPAPAGRPASSAGCATSSATSPRPRSAVCIGRRPRRPWPRERSTCDPCRLGRTPASRGRGSTAWDRSRRRPRPYPLARSAPSSRRRCR